MQQSSHQKPVSEKQQPGSKQQSSRSVQNYPEKHQIPQQENELEHSFVTDINVEQLQVKFVQQEHELTELKAQLETSEITKQKLKKEKDTLLLRYI